MNRRGRIARRKLSQALVPVEARGLPAIYLGEVQKTERSLPAVYLCEHGAEGASCRIKWLASTCLAGMFGLCLIGVAVYASMNMGDGSGMVSSIKRASLAALQPIRSVKTAHDRQSPTASKEDRIQMTATGFARRNVIHDTVVERQGTREYITIKPYVRVIAGLATEKPANASELPPFNPFKLYTDTTPVGAGETASNVAQMIRVAVLDAPGDMLPNTDGIELKPEDVNDLIAQAAENFAYAEMSQGGMGNLLQRASYRPGDNGIITGSLSPNTTVIHKSLEEEEAEGAEDVAEEIPDGAETKTVKVGRGDTLMSIIMKSGAEASQAKAMSDAMGSVFSPDALKPGQEIRLTLVPAPSDTDQMEPIKASVYDKEEAHLGTVSRSRNGDFEASKDAGDAVASAAEEKREQSQRASLYESFYQAAVSQSIPADSILKLLRVHSYDIDFKQKAKPGDVFEAFFDVPDGDDEREITGEILYTSMTVDGQTRSFYRFRTPDDVVDYYDLNGNSAKKFLMRNPVKGGRFTSAFGNRKHPILNRWRTHTGVDWAAPTGTPIMAGADGIVEQVGREGGYGNYIRIRHANGFASAYGHLSRYADGLRPGLNVKQGQIIGFVGSTGYSTGPHCHYEILVNNKFVNPMTIQVPRGLQLTGRMLAEFQKERGRIDTLMQMDPVTDRVAQAAQ